MSSGTTRRSREYSLEFFGMNGCLLQAPCKCIFLRVRVLTFLPWATFPALC